jgi:hypothetical protein
MTTVAYIDGVLACDTFYGFPVKSNDPPNKKFTAIAKEILYNSPKYRQYHTPKAIKYIESDFEIICAVSGDARFFALTHDYLESNFGNIRHQLQENSPEYIIDELSTLYDECYSSLCKEQPTFFEENPSNEPFLYLLLVINGSPYVYYFLPYQRELVLDKDQFSAIGTGRQFVKQYMKDNHGHNCIDAVSYAIEQDKNSDFPIQTDKMILPDEGYTTLPLMVTNRSQTSYFRHNLEKGMKLLVKEVNRIESDTSIFDDYM